MDIAITQFDVDKFDDIREAAEEIWNFDDWCQMNDYMSSTGNDSLCGGETEEEFAELLTHAIWKANGAYCDVRICATCLEEIPCESYSLDEKQYQEFVAKEDKD